MLLARLAAAVELLFPLYDSDRRIVSTSPMCCARGVSYSTISVPA
ncbi:hypothetical protein BgramDRAFT_5694 [Paraburkholderia graminis C4D1M]|uniref:Uncharacterized protein n=1 Tax=Paraburkholderia graminis (strain ATCC 700544 / DSM 17151 / LMG 18924 / NCIMB 13744 / C4D1M) TaxID=396598 RepID=B1G8N6_PARG4|nr:hypothetical protein BgramDRAFT_5694 [Paraburkholderia graminis C4D1M]